MSRKFVVAAIFTAITVCAQEPSGRLAAAITMGTLKVPFTMQFEGKSNGSAFAASILNGDARIRSTAASFDGKSIRIEFGQSGARLEAIVGDGGLKGTFGNEKTGMYPFKASAFCTCGFVGEAGPEIMGSWELPDNGWRLSIRRVGDDTMATLSRDGNEIGPLSGRFNGGFFELSYFDGTRAAVLEIEPRKDGGLDLSWMEPGAATKKVKAVQGARGQ